MTVEDLGEKEAVLAEGLPGFFTISHFDGYAAALIQLKRVRKRTLRDALVDGGGWPAPRCDCRRRTARADPRDGRRYAALVEHAAARRTSSPRRTAARSAAGSSTR